MKYMPKYDYASILKNIIVCSIIGFCFAVVNFQDIFLNATSANTGISKALLLSLINFFNKFISFLIETPTDFSLQALVACNFFSLLIFFILHFIFAAKRRDFHIFSYAAFGFIIGCLSLHVIFWTLYILQLLFQLFIELINYLAIFIQLIMSKAWWVILSISLISVFLIFRKYFVRLLLILISFALGILILIKIGPIIWHFIEKIILPVIKFINQVFQIYLYPIIKAIILIISTLMVFIMYCLSIIFLFSILGGIIVDQFRSAWYCCTDKKEIFLFCLSIGASISLLFFVSIATPNFSYYLNNGWNLLFSAIDAIFHTSLHSIAIVNIQFSNLYNALLPVFVHEMMIKYFTKITPPIIDSLILFCIFFLSNISITFRLFSITKQPVNKKDITYIPTYIKTIAGVLIPLILTITAQYYSGQDS